MMRRVTRLAALSTALGVLALGFFAGRSTGAEQKPPLAIAKMGNLFAGGHYNEGHEAKHVVGQLYADYYIPQRQLHPFPLVLIHGGSQTGAGWMETPDGREGWVPYFLRRGYAVYVVDQVARGRAPYHDEFYGKKSYQSLEFVLQRFAAGENYKLWPQAHLHTQFPGVAKPGDPIFDNFYASNTPSMDDRLRQTQMNVDAIAALLDRIGPSIVLVHSQSGIYPWSVTQKRPNLVKAIVALEPSGPPVHDIDFHGAPNWFTDVPAVKAYGISTIPIDYLPAVTPGSPLTFVQQTQPDAPDLVRCWRQREPARKLPVIGDRPILIVTAEASFYASYNHCTVSYLEQAGVKPTHIRLADVGLHGNGHMMMMEKNSDAVAKVVADWLDRTMKPAEAAAHH
jgi:pimeloyl-ACP methyl ester carboxylesterase